MTLVPFAERHDRASQLQSQVEHLKRQLEIAREETGRAIKQAMLNAQTVESQQREWRRASSELHAKLRLVMRRLDELEHSLETSIVELNDKWHSRVSLQQILDDGMYETEER